MMEWEGLSLCIHISKPFKALKIEDEEVRY